MYLLPKLIPVILRNGVCELGTLQTYLKIVLACKGNIYDSLPVALDTCSVSLILYNIMCIVLCFLVGQKTKRPIQRSCSELSAFPPYEQCEGWECCLNKLVTLRSIHRGLIKHLIRVWSFPTVQALRAGETRGYLKLSCYQVGSFHGVCCLGNWLRVTLNRLCETENPGFPYLFISLTLNLLSETDRWRLQPALL